MGLIVPAPFPRSVKRPAPASVYQALESRFPEALESARTLLRQPAVSATGEGVAACAEMVREMRGGLGEATRAWEDRAAPRGRRPLVRGGPEAPIAEPRFDDQP